MIVAGFDADGFASGREALMLCRPDLNDRADALLAYGAGLLAQNHLARTEAQKTLEAMRTACSRLARTVTRVRAGATAHRSPVRPAAEAWAPHMAVCTAATLGDAAVSIVSLSAQDALRCSANLICFGMQAGPSQTIDGRALTMLELRLLSAERPILLPLHAVRSRRVD